MVADIRLHGCGAWSVTPAGPSEAWEVCECKLQHSKCLVPWVRKIKTLSVASLVIREDGRDKFTTVKWG